MFKNRFFHNFTPLLREAYNPRISKTTDFEHIVLIPILLYFERPFEWCSWFSKILIFFGYYKNQLFDVT